MEQISNWELKEKLQNLLEHDALEFIDDPNPDPISGEGAEAVAESPVILIPYMMSDEIEYYFTLTGVVITGAIPRSFPSGTTLEVFDEYGNPLRENPNEKKNDGNGKDENLPGMPIQDKDEMHSGTSPQDTEENGSFDCAVTFRDGFDPLFTIWFHKAYRSVNLYRYDREGHYWTKGNEHWKRLVYIIGSTADKLKYLGPDYLNEDELELQELIGFKPFRNYSPIEESMDEYYHSTKEGIRRMRALASEAGDDWLYVFTWLYEFLPLKIIEMYLSDYLLSERGEAIYDLIVRHVREMNEGYAERRYGIEKEREMQNRREDLSQYLYEKGFHGIYPNFERVRMKNGRGEKIQILVTEEKSYAKKVLDWKDFDFDMDLLIKKTDEEGHITRFRLRDQPTINRTRNFPSSAI